MSDDVPAPESVADVAQRLLDMPRAPGGSNEDIQRVTIAAILGDEAGMRPLPWVAAAFAELARSADQRVLDVRRRKLAELKRVAPAASERRH